MYPLKQWHNMNNMMFKRNTAADDIFNCIFGQPRGSEVAEEKLRSKTNMHV